MDTNPYIPKLTKILKITRETPDTITYRFKIPSDHDPGMFQELSILGYGEAPISVSSYSKDYCDLTIRNVGRLTGHIFNMKEGEKVGLRGPYGKGYPMKNFMYKNLIIVGGGSGVAPLKAVIDYILSNQKDFKDIYLFLGFRTPNDILFRKDQKRWNEKFNYNITVDNPDEKWSGETGVITKLIDNSDLNPDNTIVLTCGPPIMIKFVIKSLQAKGFEDHQIYVSLERQMKCGIGKCGHCMIQNKHVCKDGPVFNYEEAKNLLD